MNVDTLLETTVLYFKVKKIQNTLLPFSWYKKQIQYISKIHDENIVRMVTLFKSRTYTKVSSSLIFGTTWIRARREVLSTTRTLARTSRATSS